MEKRYSLYRHTSPSGKVYIGITSQPVQNRWNHGRGYMNAEKTPFKSAIIKYGWDSIKHEVLFTNLSEEKAKHLEIELIRHYKSLGISLNYTDGGDGCHGIVPWNKGIKVPYEKSNKRKGIPLTEEHKQKLSIAHKGKHIKGHKWTEEQRAKRISQLIGRHRTEETKRKISENSASSRPIIEVDSNGIIIHTFASSVEVGRFYGISSSWVNRACKKHHVCNGHYFMFKDYIVDVSKIRYGRYKDGNQITIKNRETGEIKQFNSEQACARFLEIKSPALRKAIEKGYPIKVVWDVIARNREKLVSNPINMVNKPKAIVCIEAGTGKKIILPSIAECRRFLGLASTTAIKKALNGIRSSNIIKGWEVYYAA